MTSFHGAALSNLDLAFSSREGARVPVIFSSVLLRGQDGKYEIEPVRID